MRIANIMFSRGAGGIEQAFIDYCVGLRALGHQCIAIASPSAWASEKLQAHGIETHHLRNLGEWDILASWRLRKLLLRQNVDIVIAHGNRAFGLAHRALKDKIPLVAVAHNYQTRRYHAANGIFAITHDLIDTLCSQNIPRDKIFHIPNMIQVAELPHKPPRQEPPVIGTMGRFVAKKGFDVYINALKILKSRGCSFKAVIGGHGAESRSLRERAAQLGDNLQFLGWVQNKKEFYSGIDIFCLPSLHEPFGIVLLEAFAHGVPVISTDSEGPRDIITPNYDALMAPKGSPEAMADALEKLLNEPPLAERLAANAFAKVKTKYAPEVVCAEIEKALNNIIAGWKK